MKILSNDILFSLGANLRSLGLGAQRHAKVLGIFERLNQRDQKPAYLKHLPRVKRLLRDKLELPILEPVKTWLTNHAPHFVA